MSFSLNAPPPAAIPVCAGITGLAVSNDAANTYVRFTGPDSTFSSVTSFRIDTPNPGQYLPTTPTATMPLTSQVDGYPGSYYYKYAQTAAPTSLAVTAMNGATPVCQISSVTILSGTISSSGSYGATNPSSSGGTADCGLNPFCYIKSALYWAFVPSSGTMQGWQTQITTIKGQPPISLVLAGFTYVNAVWDGLNCAGNPASCSSTGNYQSAPPLAIQAPSGSATLDILGSAATTAGTNGANMGLFWDIVQIAIWVGAGWIIFHRIAHSFGGKTT
jgi:hypothetical protein